MLEGFLEDNMARGGFWLLSLSQAFSFFIFLGKHVVDGFFRGIENEEAIGGHFLLFLSKICSDVESCLLMTDCWFCPVPC